MNGICLRFHSVQVIGFHYIDANKYSFYNEACLSPVPNLLNCTGIWCWGFYAAPSAIIELYCTWTCSQQDKFIWMLFWYIQFWMRCLPLDCSQAFVWLQQQCQDGTFWFLCFILCTYGCTLSFWHISWHNLRFID